MFHPTQILPSKMISLNKEDFVDNFIPELNLSKDQEHQLDEFKNKSVLLPDNYVRKYYEYDPHMGGLPNPHICHPDNGGMRDKILPCSYLCSDLIMAIEKYRGAHD